MLLILPACAYITAAPSVSGLSRVCLRVQREHDQFKQRARTAEERRRQKLKDQASRLAKEKARRDTVARTQVGGQYSTNTHALTCAHTKHTQSTCKSTCKAHAEHTQSSHKPHTNHTHKPHTHTHHTQTAHTNHTHKPHTHTHTPHTHSAHTRSFYTEADAIVAQSARYTYSVHHSLLHNIDTIIYQNEQREEYERHIKEMEQRMEQQKAGRFR